MKPLLHIVSSNRLLIAAFSDHGEIVQVFHQARVALEGEHHPGPLALSIGHIPPSEGSRLGGSFRQHAHLITHPLAPCREATSTAQEMAVRKWRQAPHQARTRRELLSETAKPRGARSSNAPHEFHPDVGFPALIHRAPLIELKGVPVESTHHPAQLSAQHPLPQFADDAYSTRMRNTTRINQSRREDQRRGILTRQEQPRNVGRTGAAMLDSKTQPLIFIGGK